MSDLNLLSALNVMTAARHVQPHDQISSPLYAIWAEIREWCLNPNHACYPAYGGRGITLDLAWFDFSVFAQWAIAKGYTNGLFLVRRHGDGPFTADNCEWQVAPVPARGKRTIRVYTAFGETKRLHQWARDPRCRVAFTTFKSRMRAGWEVERALIEAPSLPTTVTAFGETKDLNAWIRDPRCRVRRVKTLRARLNARWTDGERIITWPRETPMKIFAAFGETKSPKAWSRDPRCVVPFTILRTRLYNGWEVERALTEPQHARGESPTAILVTAFGDTKSLRAWARDPRCAVSFYGLQRRIAAGWEPTLALTTPSRTRKRRKSSPR